MRYLNAHKLELFSGERIVYLGKVYWANLWDMAVYARSVEAEAAGDERYYKAAEIVYENRVTKIVRV